MSNFAKTESKTPYPSDVSPNGPRPTTTTTTISAMGNEGKVMNFNLLN